MDNTSSITLNRHIRYNDLYVRLLVTLTGAHFIVSFGEPESIFELLLMWDYYRSLAYSWAIGFCIITFIRFVTIKLDNKFDWRYKIAARASLQVLFGIGTPALIAFLLAAIYFALHHMNILHTEYLIYDFPVIVLMLALVNIYYLLYYVLVLWRKTTGKAPETVKIEVNEYPKELIKEGTKPDKYRQVIIVQVAAKNIPIMVQDISYFFRQNENNFLRTKDGTDFYVNEPLEYYEQSLDPLLFFRANRQFLVAFSTCERFENIENDKLELFVNPQYKGRVIISQKSAPSFRRWINR